MRHTPIPAGRRPFGKQAPLSPEVAGIVPVDDARRSGLRRRVLRLTSSLMRVRILLEKLVEAEEVHTRHNNGGLLCSGRGLRREVLRETCIVPFSFNGHKGGHSKDTVWSSTPGQRVEVKARAQTTSPLVNASLRERPSFS